MTPRGDTGPGRPASLPTTFYEGRNENLSRSGYVVDFAGEDGRSTTFDISSLPLPGWHADLSEAWARRLGPSGELRTLSSAEGSWHVLKHFSKHLSEGIDTPASPQQLRERHVTQYQSKISGLDKSTRSKYLHSLAALFEKEPLSGLVGEEVKAHLRPRTRATLAPVSGYSDRELSIIELAARRDVRALQDRLLVGNQDPTRSALIEEARATGVVSSVGVPLPSLGAHHRSAAETLFVTKRDLIALLVLFVILTGWNVETIKELSTDHRVLEDRAVQVQLIKRRRGAGRTEQTVTWEIGRPGRELHNPGGLYLLLLQLMEPARRLLSDDPFWAVWVGGGRVGKNGVRNPFALGLQTEESNARWAASHQLTEDPIADDREGSPLPVHFNRLKTSVDVRRVRKSGGHLPSAIRSNTVPVLFRNYILGDATTLDWAREQMAESLVDVESAALEVHRGSLSSMGRTQLSVRPTSSSAELAGEETAWTRCVDHTHHPLTGRRCTQSFLACFHCANSIITGAHLPAIIGLLDALEGRRAFISGDTWWTRYGPTWTAIRYDVLPKFTEQEVEDAVASSTADGFLDLVEPRWERP